MGCGRWGRNLLRDARELGASVVVADPSQSARDLARAAGAAATFADLAELSGVDGIIVATPASTHFEVVSSLLTRDVPLFVEKPFTLDVAQAEQLMRESAGRIFVMHVWRYHPAVIALRDLIRSGTLGPIRWLRTTRMNWTSPRTDCDPVWTLLPHDLSIILELTGDLPPVTFARAEWTNDGPAGIVTELRDAFTCIAEVSTRSARKRREIRVNGDAGVTEYEDGAGVVHVHRGDARSDAARTERIDIASESALIRELRAAFAYLRGGPDPASGAADAILIARRMDEARRMAGI